MGLALTFLVAAGAYLLGSIPTAYLATRWARGFDIRKRGSGQVGGSNVWHVVSRRVGTLVVVADVVKGMVVVLGARGLGLGVDSQVVAAIAAVSGHNWPVFLRFGGGRGIATLGGAILVLAWRETAVFAIFCVLGLVIRSFPAAIIFGVASLPVTARLLNEPAALILGFIAMFALVLARRVIPNRKWPSGELRRVLLYRALFDRDVRSREAWIRGGGRGPEQHPKAADMEQMERKRRLP